MDKQRIKGATEKAKGTLKDAPAALKGSPHEDRNPRHSASTSCLRLRGDTGFPSHDACQGDRGKWERGA
jgi:hypothetical protein